jgi:uncharacterized DUF497 family protein
MIFVWDAGKNRANIRKHGLDFADAAEMSRGALVVEPDTREDYGEKRWRGIALRGCTAVVIFAEPVAETVRVISLRKAHHEERKEYEKAIQNGLEEG